MAQIDGQPLAAGAIDVFRAFLRLGLTSFGGPIAPTSATFAMSWCFDAAG